MNDNQFYKNNQLRFFAFLLTSSKIFGRYWLISVSFLLSVNTPLAPFFWVCTSLLMLETALHLLVLSQVKATELLYHIQEFLHRFAPSIYNAPLPLNSEMKQRNSEIRCVSQVIELLPVESRGVEANELPATYAHYWSVEKAQNGTYLLTIDGVEETVSMDKIKDQLRANKNRQDVNKPSPKVQSYIDLYKDVLSEIQGLERSKKAVLDANFSKDLEQQLNEKAK
jgi:hypothetical protein